MAEVIVPLLKRPFTIAWVDAGKNARSLSFDAVLSESHQGSNIISKYPIQKGYLMSDHAMRENRIINITGVVSNVDLGGLDIEGAELGTRIGNLLGISPQNATLVGGLIGNNGQGARNYLSGLRSQAGSILDQGTAGVSALSDIGGFLDGVPSQLDEAGSFLESKFGGISLPDIPPFPGKSSLISAGESILEGGRAGINAIFGENNPNISNIFDNAGSLVPDASKIISEAKGLLDGPKVNDFLGHGRGSRIDSAYASIVDLHDKAYTCNVSTLLDTYNPVVLTSYSVEQNADKSTVMVVNLTFEELKIVGFTGSAIQSTPTRRGNKGDEQDSGTKQAKNAPNGEQGIFDKVSDIVGDATNFVGETLGRGVVGVNDFLKPSGFDFLPMDAYNATGGLNVTSVLNHLETGLKSGVNNVTLTAQQLFDGAKAAEVTAQ